ncbi:long-chain-fatty-acid--AMP ligase FAAL26/FadD26 [Mycobacterium montefiorense]|uniref:long-chain-fatty-acid--AMP ligase FAAL26/FadD26 n=1 Tax=Mycobacterium montefiorense TaxID=154654 RepID=UPI0021DDC7C3|nr:long-chain-fatty-acid--AMP ligase FAAL26/FadD26 [Mycobacterium montefiorense]MCV7427785.1 AMP-binding protein [Mycobacterium montefiorense]GLE52591.1 long-chain-fatty-acid--AMP ligase FadD26 [Mycobacterium montefiorense]
MPVTSASIPALLQARTDQQPDATAFTYIDYEQDPAGFAETLTWSQMSQRARIVAEELALCGSPGDRVAILAPQGMEYIVAFFGALEAGFIAVPLSTPQYGMHDDRISSVLRDSNPVAILTTSAVVGDVTKYATAYDGQPAPFVIEVDLLDLESPRELSSSRHHSSGAAYLQYTSGSTRTPAGVIVSHTNVIANVTQSMYAYFGDPAQLPAALTLTSWLPLYHDMGLILGLCAPLITDRSAVLMSPMSFLVRPARWMNMLATNGPCFSAAPNFAFELAVRRTSDDDMAGLDLGNVQRIVSGSERIHVATVKRFNERFASYNLSPTAIRPSYGLAEATLFVAAAEPGSAPKTVRFDYEHLTAGRARPCTDGTLGTELIGYGAPDPTSVRIVNPETMVESPEGTEGEIWVRGDHVTLGYWRKPEQTERVFNAKLADPAPGAAQGPWLRTGDLGVISDGELFIMGRIKDLLIVDGRNHYPDDIEATITEITGGRVAAISVPDDITEQLVAIIELKSKAASEEEGLVRLRSVKRKVTSAISKSHSLRVADLVLVSPGSIPITTSGKVRRSACVERYQTDGFKRLDVSV